MATLEHDAARKQTRDHLLSIREEYFNQDLWYVALRDSGLEHLTFRSEFVEVGLDEAACLLSSDGAGSTMLTAKLAEAQRRLGSDRIFVKFVRSPKDATRIYTAATESLATALRAQPGRSLWHLFAEARQEALGCRSAEDAVALLRSSGRVCAAQGSEWAPEGGDLWWAVHGERFGNEFAFAELRPRLMVREFSGALPLASEWRAFIWDGHCSAVTQYFYQFGFEELQNKDLHAKLARDLEVFLAELVPALDQMPAKRCMLDLAWTPGAAQPFVLIEVNPFDPERGLGHTSSLALFDWETDKQQICAGATIEVRVAPLRSEVEMVQDTNRSWSTVSSQAREALRLALERLPPQDLDKAHAVTREIARKLGLYRGRQGSTKEGEGGKGMCKGKESSIGGKAPQSLAAYGKNRAPHSTSSLILQGSCLAMGLSEFEQALAARKAKSSVGECSNMDVTRSLIRTEADASLWLGNMEDAMDADALRRDGITHILNCASDVPSPPHAHDFQYMRLDLHDTVVAGPALAEVLQGGRALQFIEAGLVDGGGILVHCRLGRSRSASLVVAFLVALRGSSYEEALGEVKKKRWLYGGSLVEPNQGFKAVLQYFAGCQAVGSNA